MELTVRGPVTRLLDFQFSVPHLRNTNNSENLVVLNASVPLTAQTNTGQTSIPSTLILAAPGTVRVQMRLDRGREIS